MFMKNNYEVAHAFAYGASVGKGSHLFIDGDSIYSYGYHFCIAKRVSNDAILFTTREYSNTTAKHKHYVLSATSHMKVIYCNNPSGSHDANQDDFLKQILYLMPKLARARKREKWIYEIQVVCERAKNYCEFFGVKMHKDLAMFVYCEDFADANQEYLAELRKREEKARREKIKRCKESLALWHRFETNYAPNLDFQELRFNESENRIETTMSVKIPYEIGKVFYKRLKSGDIHVGDELLHYQVMLLDKKDIRIGCHRFKMRYLMDFGKELFG